MGFYRFFEIYFAQNRFFFITILTCLEYPFAGQ